MHILYILRKENVKPFFLVNKVHYLGYMTIKNTVPQIHILITVLQCLKTRRYFEFKMHFALLKLQSVSFTSLSPSLFENLELQHFAELSCFCGL